MCVRQLELSGGPHISTLNSFLIHLNVSMEKDVHNFFATFVHETPGVLDGGSFLLFVLVFVWFVFLFRGPGSSPLCVVVTNEWVNLFLTRTPFSLLVIPAVTDHFVVIKSKDLIISRITSFISL